MLSSTKATNSKAGWTLKSPATPEVINEYVSGTRFGDNDEVTQAARNAAAEHFKTQEAALLRVYGELDKLGDIAGNIVVYVDAYIAGATEVVKHLNDRIVARR